MRITTRCFASLREIAGDRRLLELPEGASLADAWAALAAEHRALEAHGRHVRGARNHALAGWDEPLADGDEIAFLPPVSGGSGQADPGWALLTEAPIDVAALESSVAGPGHGALVTFIGRARDRSDDGREVVELEYEAYAEMAAGVLRQIVAEAEAAAPGSCVAVAHRVGVVPLGEAAVAIVAAAAHRDAAYAANRYVIEAIKERLPIWKRERFPDGSEWKRPGA